MARSKVDKRKRQVSAKTRGGKQNKVDYNKYKCGSASSNRLQTAVTQMLNNNNTKSFGQVSAKYHIPKTTLYRKLHESKDLGEFTNINGKRLALLTEAEETAVEQYCLWQGDRGMNLKNNHVKALIREIHSQAVENGEKRQPMNSVTGPSAKFMRNFYQRYPALSYRSSETVDRGRINNATQSTITDYFNLLKESLVKDGIMELDSNGEVIQDSIKSERIYLADETGWGVSTKRTKVIGRKGSKHVYQRKPNDESHKTLMLTICGNGDVLKPLIILEKSFPLVGEGEGEQLPDGILLSKTLKGSMETDLFVQWLESCVIPHKAKHNPEDVSYLIVDNHGSRFSTMAIDLCIEHKVEMLCYPGHLTHILQGPDVVLNKPLSTQIENLVFTNPQISGNSDLTRIAFIAIICHAVETVCSVSNVKMAFEATGIMPFNPARIDLSSFPTSYAGADVISDSPIKATCSKCRISNVELHPLVKQGVVPKHIAGCFTYTPPPKKSKTKSKVVKTARIITSEEVKAEVRAVEERKNAKNAKKILKVKLPVSKKACQKDGTRSKMLVPAAAAAATSSKRAQKRKVQQILDYAEESDSSVDLSDDDDTDIVNANDVDIDDDVDDDADNDIENDEDDELFTMISNLQGTSQCSQANEDVDDVNDALNNFKKGDVVKVLCGRFEGWYAMVEGVSYVTFQGLGYIKRTCV